MPSSRDVVIVGASLAGAKAAETLRKEGFDGGVILLGDEPVRPYERPPLSKAYLRGEAAFDVAAVHDPDFYRTNAIDLQLSTTITAVDPDASEVELESGEGIAYLHLLLTTGAEPRRLTGTGPLLQGIHYLRTVADSDAIRAAVTRSVPVVVVGAGWIGCEVAASARQLGADVTLVDSASVPLQRVLGPEVGGIFRDLHTDHGVAVRLGVGVQSIDGDTSVEQVVLADGSVLPAGAVVVGIGVSPRTGLAAAAGLAVENGVLTDEYLETSALGIYAAGDVANAFHPTYGHRVRLEHWSSALNQGPVAARNILGARTPYDRIPYFFSDQYELGTEYRGLVTASDDVVFRGSTTEQEFIAFWLRDDRVVGAMNANVWDQSEQLEALVASAPVVDRRQLSDPTFDLGALTGS